jgi:NifU-like protein involved in Fe-S cluster formation
MALGSRSLFRADGLTLQTGHMRIRNMGKYSETLTEHVMAPRNGGVIENTDLTGHAGAPGRGAFMIISLKVQDERIAAAKYQSVGCGPTITSGSMLTEMIAGRSIAEC